MIKMVASDLDGTLLQNGAQALKPPVFELIRDLREKGNFVCSSQWTAISQYAAHVF